MKDRVAGRFTWAGATLSVSLPDRFCLARLSDLLSLAPDSPSESLCDMRVHSATHMRSFKTELTFATQSDLLIWLALTIVDVLAEKANAFLIHAASLRFGSKLVLLS